MTSELDSEVFRVLYVCTGNICRSPMAEVLTRAGLHERLGAAAQRVVVDSAGTWGQTGRPMEPYALRTLAAYGLSGTDFRARELAATHVAAADLVLAATREHRAAAVVLLPARLPERSRCVSSPGSPTPSTRPACPTATCWSGLAPWCGPRRPDGGWCRRSTRGTTTSPIPTAHRSRRSSSAPGWCTAPCSVPSTCWPDPRSGSPATAPACPPARPPARPYSGRTAACRSRSTA